MSEITQPVKRGWIPASERWQFNTLRPTAPGMGARAAEQLDGDNYVVCIESNSDIRIYQTVPPLWVVILGL